MAIHQLGSEELVTMMIESKETIEAVERDVSNIYSKIDQRAQAIKSFESYNAKMLEDIKEKIESMDTGSSISGLENKVVFSSNEEVRGVFDKYGSTIHRKFIKEPLNVFNIKTPNQYLFRNNMGVSINGVRQEAYKHLLRHDRIAGKELAYFTFEEPQIKLEIAVDTTAYMGDTTCNVIEWAPLMLGSVNIKEVRIYNDQNDEDAAEIISPYGRPGKSRFILKRKHAIKRVEFDLELLHKNSGGDFVFGMEHIYFLNADFVLDSYFSAKISKRKYVAYINNKVKIKAQHGIEDTTLEELGGALYLSRSADGVLEYMIPASTDREIHDLSRNTREFYVRIPLKSYSMITLEMHDVGER